MFTAIVAFIDLLGVLLALCCLAALSVKIEQLFAAIFLLSEQLEQLDTDVCKFVIKRAPRG